MRETASSRGFTGQQKTSRKGAKLAKMNLTEPFAIFAAWREKTEIQSPASLKYTKMKKMNPNGL